MVIKLFTKTELKRLKGKKLTKLGKKKVDAQFRILKRKNKKILKEFRSRKISLARVKMKTKKATLATKKKVKVIAFKNIRKRK